MEMYIIKSKAIDKNLRIAEHYELHRTVVVLMEILKDAVPDEKLRLLIATYVANFAIEKTIFKFEQAAVETPQLKEADGLRDEDFTYLESRVKTAAKHDPDPERKAKAKLLQHIFKNYKKIRRKPYPEQTGLMWGMIEDLDKPENKAIITALGLTDGVEAARTDNGEFERLWGERGHAYDEARKLGTQKDARARVQGVCRIGGLHQRPCPHREPARNADDGFGQCD